MYRSTVIPAPTVVTSSPAVLIATLLVVNLVIVGTFGGVWWLLCSIRPRFPAATPTTISRLTSPPPVPVAVTGVVAAGPDGPVTSPLSRESCAWYRLNSFRRRESLDSSVRYEKVSELISDGDVVISDGTGSATLSMGDVEHYGGWLVQSTSTPRRPAGTGVLDRAGTALLSRGLRQDEYVIPIGATVTVIGRLVLDRGRLRPADGTHPLAATPQSLQQFQAGQQEISRRSRQTARLMLVLAVTTAALLDAVALWAIFG
ncbi:hypothetical protein ACVBEQ_22255 [Nakamurella sp. GG22]